MIKKVCFCLFFLFSNSLSHSQNSIAIDSLEKVLQFAKNDTVKINALNDISFILVASDPQKAKDYANKALLIAQKIEWETGIANSYHNIGYVNYAQGNFPVALDYWLKVLVQREKINNKEAISSAIGNVGTIYFHQANYPKALEYYIKGLKLAEEIRDTAKIIANLTNVGMIYKRQNDFEKALEYQFKALKMVEKSNRQNEIGIVYGSIAGSYWRQGNITKALEYYFKAIEIDEKMGNKRNVGGWLANIGGVYALKADSADANKDKEMQNLNNQKALEYNLKALKIAEELDEKSKQAIILGNIGSLYTQLIQYNEAEDYLQKSLKLATSINIPDQIKDVHESFYILYSHTNQYAKALEHYKKYIETKDSIFNENNSKIISELQIKYETEKKEAENAELIHKNELQALTIINNRYLLVGLIGLFIILIIIGFLITRQNKLKAHQQAIHLEQKLLRTQMNPHFIFNSLASIESFIYEHEPKEAGVYLSSFSRLMRLILENSSSEYITLEKEIETLNYYLSLQKLRLDGNLSYSIKVNKSIHNEEIYLPPMLTQPFIENAIEHGFRGANEQGNIKIIFSIKEDDLQVEVIDNGIGIEQAQQQKYLHHKHKSMAIEITIERLKFLNRSKKKKLTFDISDISNKKNGQSGTKVLFSIPLGLQNNKI